MKGMYEVPWRSLSVSSEVPEKALHEWVELLRDKMEAMSQLAIAPEKELPSKGGDEEYL
jgi:hypothetical protein